MTTLAQYNTARAALAEATRVDQVLPIIDEIAHVKLYARQIEDQTLLADAQVFQMRAERRLGVIIQAGKQAGHFREGRPKKPKNGAAGEPLSATLEEVGVGKKLSARAQKRAGIGERAFEMMVEATRERIAAGSAPVINGERALMGSRQEPGDSLDYFPTPPWATRALVELVLPELAITEIKSAWEPACGEGHIAEVLREYADTVIATDIHDYGYGQAPLDFLGELPPNMSPDWIVTNPPFDDLAVQFVLRALERAQIGVAMFFRLQWIPTKGRYEKLFRDMPPTLVAFFCERVNLCKGRWDPDGSTATDYIWLVWRKGEQPRAPFWIPPNQRKLLERPGDRERFTTHPVTKAVRCDEAFDPATGELSDPPKQGEAA